MGIRDTLNTVIELEVAVKLLQEFPSDHEIHHGSIHAAIRILERDGKRPGLLKYLHSVKTIIYYVDRIGE